MTPSNDYNTLQYRDNLVGIEIIGRNWCLHIQNLSEIRKVRKMSYPNDMLSVNLDISQTNNILKLALIE